MTAAVRSSSSSPEVRRPWMRPRLREARQEKFVGIVGVARLRAHKRRKNGILHRRLPPLTERAAQADVPLEHPRRAAAGQLVDAGIGLGQRPGTVSARRPREAARAFFAQAGRSRMSGRASVRSSGAGSSGSGAGRAAVLPAAAASSSAGRRSRPRPAPPRQHAARDQAVACDGKSEQDRGRKPMMMPLMERTADPPSGARLRNFSRQ